MEPTKKLLLLDAYALIFRAFYAMIRSPRVTSTGIDTSAVFGFVNTLQDLLKRERPSHIAVCFDPPGGKTFRHESYEPYKANREKTPEGILVAVPYIKRILQAYRIPIFEVEGYEADDVIGTLSHQAEISSRSSTVSISRQSLSPIRRDGTLHCGSYHYAVRPQL